MKRLHKRIMTACLALSMALAMAAPAMAAETRAIFSPLGTLFESVRVELRPAPHCVQPVRLPSLVLIPAPTTVVANKNGVLPALATMLRFSQCRMARYRACAEFVSYSYLARSLSGYHRCGHRQY